MHTLVPRALSATVCVPICRSAGVCVCACVHCVPFPSHSHFFLPPCRPAPRAPRSHVNTIRGAGADAPVEAGQPMLAAAAVNSPEIRRAATAASSLRRDNRSSIRMRGSDPGALLTSSKDLQGRIGKLCEQLERSLSIGVASVTERSMHKELLSAKEEMDSFFQGLHAAVVRIAAAENAPV
eukprot:scaffold36310_cov118-Isochrysis_galbana.AAC.4